MAMWKRLCFNGDTMNMNKISLRKEKLIFAVALFFWVCILLCYGCAHYDKEKNIFYGYGRYKDSEIEIESKPIFSDLVNISALRQN